MKKAPHLLHPEILHWQTGDEIQTRNLEARGFFRKMSAIEDGKLNLIYIYKGLTREGLIIVEDKESGKLHKTDFRKFIRKAKNISLDNRKIMMDMSESEEYMELMKEFQKAYKELEAHDQGNGI